MTGKGAIYRLFLLVVTALAVAGCTPPIRSMGGISNPGVPDELIVEGTHDGDYIVN